MNYQALKWLIDNIINNYKCPNCWENIEDSNIDIIWAAWTTINIDVWCEKCSKHSMIKSEILSIDISKIWLAKEWIWFMKDKIEEMKNKLIEKKENSIKDEKIQEINKKLKVRNIKVEDFFS